MTMIRIARTRMLHAKVRPVAVVGVYVVAPALDAHNRPMDEHQVFHRPTGLSIGRPVGAARTALSLAITMDKFAPGLGSDLRFGDEPNRQSEAVLQASAVREEWADRHVCWHCGDGCDRCDDGYKACDRVASACRGCQLAEARQLEEEAS